MDVGMRGRLPIAATAALVIVAALPVAAQNTPADVDTTEVTVYEEDDVVVTTSRYDNRVHLSHTNLTGDEIRRRQSARDIPFLLGDVPGLFSYSDAGNGIGYTYLRIRGFDQRRVGVLVNGIPLNDPEDHQVYWVDLPDLASSVEDIQVQRGVTNSVGGVTAIGGTVNLVTDVLAPWPEGRATVEAGSFGTNRRMIKYSTGDLGSGFSTGLRLSQLESDGYRDRSGSEQWAVFWSGRWQGEVHSLQANFYTGHEVSQHAWDAVPESILAVDRTYNPEKYWNAIDDFRQPHYELHWEWQIGRDVMLRNSAYVIHGEGFYENFKTDETAARYSLDAYFPDLYAPEDEVDLVRQKWVRKDQVGWVPTLVWNHRGGRLTVGGDWYTFHSNHWGDVLFAGPGSGEIALVPDAIADGVKYHDFSGDKTAWSAFANELWEFTPGLTLLADVQIQRREYDFLQAEVGNFTGTDRNAYTVDHDFFNPKGGLFWRTPWRPKGGEVGLYGNVGITHREPADSEYWDTWEGPDDLGARPLFGRRDVATGPGGEPGTVHWSDPLVEPERVVNYEGGAAFRGRTLSFTVNGYWMDFENEIVPSGYYDPDRGILRGNAGRTLHRGIELGLRWRPHPDHGLRLAASRSWDEYKEFIFQDYDWDTGQRIPRDYSGNPIALFPDRLVSAIWTSRLGAFSGDLRLRHLGKQYLDNSGDARRTIDPATVFDLYLFCDIERLTGVAGLQGLQAYLRLFNLFDVEYETWGYTFGENYKLPAATRNFLVGVNYDF